MTTPDGITLKKDIQQQMVAVIVDSHPNFIQGMISVLDEMFPTIKVLRFGDLQELHVSLFEGPLAFVLLGINESIKRKEMNLLKSIIKRFEYDKIIVLYTQVTFITPLLHLPVRGFISKSTSMIELKKLLTGFC